jgi:hypothetical protein
LFEPTVISLIDWLLSWPYRVIQALVISEIIELLRELSFCDLSAPAPCAINLSAMMRLFT